MKVKVKVKVKVELSYLGRGEKMSNMQAWAAQPLMPASSKGYPESHVRSRDVFTLSVLPPTKSGFQVQTTESCLDDRKGKVTFDLACTSFKIYIVATVIIYCASS